MAWISGAPALERVIPPLSIVQYYDGQIRSERVSRKNSDIYMIILLLSFWSTVGVFSLLVCLNLTLLFGIGYACKRIKDIVFLSSESKA